MFRLAFLSVAAAGGRTPTRNELRVLLRKAQLGMAQREKANLNV